MSKSRERVSYFMAILVLVMIWLISSGCTILTKTIFVPPSTPVMLRQDLPRVKVWILDEETKRLIATEKDLKIGQHVLTYDKIKGGQ